MKNNEFTEGILRERFCGERLISVATAEDNMPYVRAVNAVYLDGAFYVVTYALSNKMRQLEKNPIAAICGEWFTAHATAENLGYVLLEQNAAVMQILRKAFASWYGNGHVDESDRNVCLLKLRLRNGVLFSDGIRYDLEFS